MASDKPNSRRRRRWRSAEEAYQSGQLIGFMAACELMGVLEDPAGFAKEIRDLGGQFAEAIRRAQGDPS